MAQPERTLAPMISMASILQDEGKGHPLKVENPGWEFQPEIVPHIYKIRGGNELKQ